MVPLKFLLVESISDNSNPSGQWLEVKGNTVFISYDFEDAIAKFAQFSFDIVLIREGICEVIEYHLIRTLNYLCPESILLKLKEETPFQDLISELEIARPRKLTRKLNQLTV